MAKPTKTGLVKKKTWMPILAPAIFNNAQIGETYIEDPDAVIGRKMKVSLTAITGDPQRQNILVSLRIIGKRENKFTTEIEGYGLAPASIRKMMRRRKNKITESFMAKTKDGKILRIKPMAITRFKTSGSTLTALRKQLCVEIAKKISTLKFADMIHELVVHKFQKEILRKLKKVYPMQICEIKQLTIEAGKKAGQKVEEEKKEEKKPVEEKKSETAEV